MTTFAKTTTTTTRKKRLSSNCVNLARSFYASRAFSSESSARLRAFLCHLFFFFSPGPGLRSYDAQIRNRMMYITTLISAKISSQFFSLSLSNINGLEIRLIHFFFSLRLPTFSKTAAVFTRAVQLGAIIPD